MRKVLIVTVILLLGLAEINSRRCKVNYVNVDIDKGTLRGFKTTTWRGIQYSAFKGIPYAKPPIGDLRFKGPEEELSWNGVRNAVDHKSVCPQLIPVFKILRGNEDCLFLNVYTPFLQGERLPVMVWIHGGGFTVGSGNDGLYGPDYLMEAGIVLVTLNYRLGALGFLTTGDDGAPGNAGLKDQVAALKWVKRNIAKFGGDPDNVTLFGESAGGASTHYHLLSPMSSGLFKRAIGQSGSALNPWALSENGPSLTVRLAEALGAENVGGDTTKTLKFLRETPYENIINIQETPRTAKERIRVWFLFTPSVEKNVTQEEVFLPNSPLDILQSGNFNKVPYITGYNDKEGYFFYKELTNPKVMQGAIEDTECYVPKDIKNKNLRNELGESIRKFYFDDKPIGNENISNLVDLYTDTTFAAGIYRATKLQLRFTEAPIYFYVLPYDGGLNLLKSILNVKLSGACHADDIGYLFYQKLLFWRKPGIGSEDEAVINTMIRLWTNFAKYGDPTPDGDDITWKPVTNGKFNYLSISGWDTKHDVDPDVDRMNFWNDAYEREEDLRNCHAVDYEEDEIGSEQINHLANILPIRVKSSIKSYILPLYVDREKSVPRFYTQSDYNRLL